MSKPRRGVIKGDDRVLRSVTTTTTTPAEGYLLDRTDDLPIEFKGWAVGKGERSNEHRTTTVLIYVTAGKNIVVRVHKTREDKEPLSTAEVFSDPAEAIAWIRGDRTSLGIASKKAWEQACEAVDWLKKHGTVWVE